MKAFIIREKYILFTMKVFKIKGSKFKKVFINLFLSTELVTYFVTFEGGAKTP